VLCINKSALAFFCSFCSAIGEAFNEFLNRTRLQKNKNGSGDFLADGGGPLNINFKEDISALS
jgi:hypothetical protein